MKAVLAIAVLCVLGGSLRLGLGVVDTPRVDHLCGDGRVSGCLDGHEGRVVSVSGADVHVIWDDGAHSETLSLAGDARPAARELVRVELWDGKAVSITDARGHRYRDDVMWPGGYPEWSIGGLCFGVFLIGAVYVKPLVRRLRRR